MDTASAFPPTRQHLSAVRIGEGVRSSGSNEWSLGRCADTESGTGKRQGRVRQVFRGYD